MAMYRSMVSPLSVWLLCATSFFIFCQSSLQQDTLYVVMELASASRLLIFEGSASSDVLQTVLWSHTLQAALAERGSQEERFPAAQNHVSLWPQILKRPQNRGICGKCEHFHPFVHKSLQFVDKSRFTATMK